MSPLSQVNTMDLPHIVLPDFSLLNLTVPPASIPYSHMAQPYANLSFWPLTSVSIAFLYLFFKYCRLPYVLLNSLRISGES